jgi:hypothetical protein
LKGQAPWQRLFRSAAIERLPAFLAKFVVRCVCRPAACTDYAEPCPALWAIFAVKGRLVVASRALHLNRERFLSLIAELATGSFYYKVVPRCSRAHNSP